ncbi:MAG: tetratricopeptide repeat protein [Desulfobacterales bacterium]|jgi:tetratricopeptide (TPR) repeat protein
MMKGKPKGPSDASFTQTAAKTVIEQLRRLPEVDVPEGLARRIMTALPSRKKPWWQILLLRLSRPQTISFIPLKWVPVGTALLLGMLIGYGLHGEPGKTISDARPQTIQSQAKAELHYALGRQLLAVEQAEQALPHLQRAVETRPNRALYHFWLGVNYWTVSDLDQELAHYREALKLDPDFLPAHVYTAHNLLDRGDWQAALRHYRRVLQEVPNHPEALFNSALAHQNQDDQTQANELWSTYLDYYDRGAQALQAVEHLNANGNFTFRRIRLGPVDRVIKSITFRRGGTLLDETSRTTLDDIGRILAANRKLVLHVVAYAENDAEMAHRRAHVIKRHLTGRFDDIAPRRIKLSWFGVPETVHMEGHAFQLDPSIQLFATTFDAS